MACEDIVRMLYIKLTDETCQVTAHYSQWFEHWESVHGALERKRTVDRKRLAKQYRLDPAFQLSKLLFAIETTYVVWMKFQALLHLSRTCNLERLQPTWPDSRLRRSIREVLSGALFRDIGLLNYGGGSLFDWFVDALSHDDMALFRAEFCDLEDAVSRYDALHEQDMLRAKYHQIVPKQARHSLGAFYTPEWLADYILGTLGFADPEQTPASHRLLDPTCGSGTFLIAAVRRVLSSKRALDLTPQQRFGLALDCVVGFDIDPVAVVAAKTNLVFLLCSLLDEGARIPAEGVRLPVTLCDSVYPPQTEERQVSFVASEKQRVVRLGSRQFRLPYSVVTPSNWGPFVDDLIASVSCDDNSHSRQWSKSVASGSLQPRDSDLAALHEFFSSEYKKGLLDFYGELLRDAPEPLFQGPFEYVAGNPPWVNWEYLPPAYRDMVQGEWPKLGLYGLKGLNHAFSKEDISVLVTYVSCQRYLAEHGKLGFVLPQSLFQSSLNAKGFRRFRIGNSGAYLRVLQVDDLVEINPFEGVANRTSVLFLEKGRQTSYPVRYRKWMRRDPPEPSRSFTWEEYSKNVVIEEQVAAPTDSAEVNSYWSIVPAMAVGLLERLSGSCAYRARTGMFTGGANGVFYLEIIEQHSDGKVRVRNITEGARRSIPPVEASMEPDHVYPLLRGRNVEEWRYTIDAAVLLAHTPETKMRAIDPVSLQAAAPLTYEYLEQFKLELGDRRGFGAWEQSYVDQAFYVVQRIGEYTFAPYKVVWRYICKDFRCCVVGPEAVGSGDAKPVIPHEKLMLIGLHDPQEAHYVCAVLTSAPVRFFIETRMVETQIAPHVIQRLALPTFDPSNVIHTQIAQACHSGHAARAARDEPSFAAALHEVDALVSGILKVSSAESMALRQRLDVHK